MPRPSFIKPCPGGVLLSVKVQPRASRNEIAEPLGDDLRVKVTAPPVDSAANDAVIALLAQQLEVPRRRVVLVRGQTSRRKVFRVDDIEPGEAAKRLGLA